MVRQWQCGGRALYGLLLGIAVLFLAVTVGRAAPAPAQRAGTQPSNLQPSNLQRGEGAPDWQALLRKVEGIDPSKPDAVATLKEVVAELIRLDAAQARELEALRGEVQSLRAAPTTTASARGYRGATRSAATTPSTSSAAPASTATSTAATPAGMFGKVGLKKLHKVGCQFGDRIKEGDRVYFKTVGEAAKAGYEPCKVCRPGG